MDNKEKILADWDPTAARNSGQVDRGSTRSVQIDSARGSATSMFTRMSLAQGTQSLPTQTALEVMMMLTENLKNDDGESSLDSTDEHGGEKIFGAREFRKSRSMFDVLDQRGRDGSQASSPRKICRHLSNNISVVMFLAFVTLWVLFSDDLRFACMPPRADPAMGWISIVCMCIFLLEIIMYSLASRSYVGSFFFWLDVLATASMIFDIPAVEDAIFNLLNGDSTTLESAALARATRTSRVGTKAGRIASAVRVMRLVRVVKLFKHVEGRSEDDGRRNKSRASVLAPQVQQSRVGQKLSELTTRRVVLGVLTMVFVLPYWDISNGVYGGSPTFQDLGLKTLHNQALLDNTGSVFTQALDDYKSGVRYYLGSKKTSQLLYLSVANVTYVSQSPLAETLRSREVHVVEEKTAGCNPDNDEECLVSGSMLSRKWDSRLDSILQMCKTVFILIVLGGGALLFSADANRLVLIPVDRMVQRVKSMADNPRSFQKPQSVAGQQPYQDTALQAADTEMRILEASIDKISELLAVAFGDAGVDIIAENMRCMGGLDPMVPGQRTVAIFGFCDIRNFTDLTEVLQEGVMSFVNTVAQIVHSEVHLHDGAANKNIGDAFLLVWKFREGFTAKHLRGLLKAFKTGGGPEPSSAGGLRTGRSLAGSLDSVNGMPGYDSLESSIRSGDNEDAFTSHSSPRQYLAAQPSKRGYHSPSISWGDLGQQSSPKPLQILPTHLSIPDNYLTPASLEPFPETLSATSAAAVAPLPPSVAEDSTAVDMALVEPSGASEEGAATQGPCKEVSTKGNGNETRDSMIVQQDSVIVHNGSMLDHGDSMIEHEGSIIEHEGSVIEHDGSIILHEGSVIDHQDLALVHNDSQIPNDGEGQPLGEGLNDGSSSTSIPERSSGVSFSPEPRRNLHRHKSSNYSRLLDFRVDEWLPRKSDPLNVPEDLRDGPEGLQSALVSRSAVSALSFSESKLDNIAMQRRTKRFNSNEIMAMLPDKLRSQAEHAQSLADSALNSFVIVNAALQRSAALCDYVTREDVKKRMGNDFRVGMGFGLHAGWSIEGAIGSKHKVDASYLSPNVNMAARLESATKQYGVAILMSADFTALLSSAMRAKCRQIDTVLVKGSSQPMGIWTIDTDTRWIKADQASTGGSWRDPSMYVHNSKTEAERTSTLDEFENHQDIVQSYCGSEEFLEKWKAGFNHYKSGAWQEARALLEETYTMRRDVEGNIVRDTPSKVLMDYMAKTQFCAPGDWNGHRELTEK